MNDLTAYAFEVLTVPKGSAGGTTLTKNVYLPPGSIQPKAALITVNPGPNISFRVDGVTATTGTGHQITAFMQQKLYGYQQIKDFTTVSVKSATAASISVSYLR